MSVEVQGREVVQGTHQHRQEQGRTRKRKARASHILEAGIQPGLKPDLPGPLNPRQTLVLYCCITNRLKTQWLIPGIPYLHGSAGRWAQQGGSPLGSCLPLYSDATHASRARWHPP